MLHETHAQEVAVLKKHQQIEEHNQVSKMTLLFFVIGSELLFVQITLCYNKPLFRQCLVTMQMQSHCRALKGMRKKMEAQASLAHQEIEAATASNNALSALSWSESTLLLAVAASSSRCAREA